MATSRLSLTIQQRLIALIVLLTVAIVGALAVYFTSRQIDDLTAALRGKATAYGQLVAKQATSAVAFSDRETAREVVASIAADPEVAAVELVGSAGTPLFTHGTPTPGLAKDATARTLSLGDRIAVIVPVVSLEGPRGVLALELSTAKIAAARATLTRTAIVTGALALIFAIAMAWLIASRVARRLRAIAKVATAVAGGDLEQRPVADARRDEIGALASAFNAMLAQLKQLIGHMEGLVAERTAALDARNAEMRLVFDHVDQGLLVVDLDGTIAPEHSAAVERWLGGIPASRQLVDYLRAFAPDRADWFAAMWSALDAGMPIELAVAQLPATFVVGDRHIAWSYKPFVTPSGATRVLIVMSDITAEVERQRTERDERECMSLFSRLVRDRAGLIASRAEAIRLVDEIAADPLDPPAFKRSVHTLKGLAGLLELGSLAETCHALESAFAEDDAATVAALRTAIGERWRFLAARIAPLVDSHTGALDVTERDLAQLETALARGAGHDEIARLLRSWRDERAAAPLDRLAELARAVAARLGKPLDITVDADASLRVPAHFAPAWSAMTHVIRNAVDHGIEADRAAAGKPAAGSLALRAFVEPNAIAVEIADDGSGIAWSRVAAAARARGLAADTPADLEAALFHDGLSTRDGVSETSGRGVGLGAVRDASQATGGRVSVESTGGRGTRFRFTWPLARPRTLSRPALQVL